MICKDILEIKNQLDIKKIIISTLTCTKGQC